MEGFDLGLQISQELRQGFVIELPFIKPENGSAPVILDEGFALCEEEAAESGQQANCHHSQSGDFDHVDGKVVGRTDGSSQVEGNAESGHLE